VEDLASLLAIAASWVAPGAGKPDEPETLDGIKRFLEGAGSLSRLFDGHGKRVAGYYEATHPLNVAALSIAIGRAMGLPDEEIEDLVRAALLHDLGLRLVPSAIRHKLGALTGEELAILRRHSEHSARLAEVLCGPAVAKAVLSHHERWDGTGYPQGLAGPEIPLHARILAVADSFDAMSSDRIYARRYSPALAFQAVRASAGRAFDPAVASAFLGAVSPFPPGTPVRLASGETGVVARPAPGRPFRPVVRLGDGTEVEGRDVVGLQIVRSAPRFTAGVPVALRLGAETHEGRTFNLSEEGAAVVEYTGQLRHGGDVAVEFRPRGREPLELPARVVWSRPSGGRGRLIGLWFGPVPEEARAYLKALTASEPAPATSDFDPELETARTPGTSGSDRSPAP